MVHNGGRKKKEHPVAVNCCEELRKEVTYDRDD